jgi:hypothetical protein
MPHLVETKVANVAISADSVHRAKSPRQGSLVDSGQAAQITHVHVRVYVGARDLLEMVDQPSIALSLRGRHGTPPSPSWRRLISWLPLTEAMGIDLAQRRCINIQRDRLAGNY